MTILVRSGVVAASRRYALELVRPSSIAFAGGGSETASIVGLGSVDFSAVTSLSLNGVFSAEYDNYMVAIRHKGSTTQVNVQVRLRLSGIDASGTDYTLQNLQAYSTTVSSGRQTSQTFGMVGNGVSTLQDGAVTYIYGPALAQPTAARVVDVNARDSAWIKDVAWTHSLSTAYDGITVYPSSGSITGNIAVYGLRG